MKTVYAKHEPYTNGHIGLVADELDHAGPPTIRVIEQNGAYYALEGSHRLYLAHQRGLIPKLVVMKPELGEDLDTFWNRVSPDLPRYDFDHAFVLNLTEVELKYEKDI